ncbi:hypothetical protein PTSG_08856 [Salpingoeca rosetta]|uniref:Pyrrolo-quinoline quinone repeat domain-containing protein n=1 Tax=Salpingoeca rosetta (strain ATCC 50818 / BSB-021) TaxID=946362 RepID=F2UKW8_SALR5|nr:uncharacterized protein PTSG_08856 [Salpingoeca rosetta]EGD77767.1 hypothetical protein PTSG_08856 [Salpingoeca rosetta]|eukprot:XP_004990243.1 hypothetical protein PTSG_08856 [Salpingoeca rosetta]
MRISTSRSFHRDRFVVHGSAGLLVLLLAAWSSPSLSFSAVMGTEHEDAPTVVVDRYGNMLVDTYLPGNASREEAGDSPPPLLPKVRVNGIDVHELHERVRQLEEQLGAQTGFSSRLLVQLGGAGDDHAYAGAFDWRNGRVFIGGRTASDVPGAVLLGFVACMDRVTGTVIWHTVLNSTRSSVVLDIALDNGSTEDVLATGFTFGPIAEGTMFHGGQDSFVVRLDSDTGDIVWSQQLGSAGDESGRGVAVDTDMQRVYVSGHSGLNGDGHSGGEPIAHATVTCLHLATGQVLWTKTFDDNDMLNSLAIRLHPRRHTLAVAVTGEAPLAGHMQGFGDLDAFVVMMDSVDGEVLWVNGIGTDKAEILHSVAIDETTGDVFLSGTTTGTLAAAAGEDTTDRSGAIATFIARFRGADGQLMWVRQFGSSSHENSRSVAVDSARGSVYMCGWTRSPLLNKTLVGNTDSFVMQLRMASGEPVRAAIIGSVNGDELGQSVVVHPKTGEVCVIGDTSSVVTPHDPILPLVGGAGGGGGQDVFVRCFVRPNYS